MFKKCWICSLLLNLLIASVAWSKERAIRPVAEAVNPNLRQALVIGNSEYEHAGRLRNPVNDAKAIGSTLQRLGFRVTLLMDADQRRMESTIRDFGDQLRQRKGVGLFYYAGHGMQLNGENYLLPTDINPSSEEDVRYDAIPLGKLLAQMQVAKNTMNVVILDACRNNPFPKSFRTFNPGLVQVNAAAGTFISFATAPGQVAADGEGTNGLFTGKLLRHIDTPDIKIEEVFKRTTADVYRESNQRQAPWVQYSVIGDFYFVLNTGTTEDHTLLNAVATEQTLYISESDWRKELGSSPKSWKAKRETQTDRVYLGEIDKGMPNGQGTLTWEDGDQYVGQWKNGRYHGLGLIGFSGEETIFEGHYKDGRFVGKREPLLQQNESEPSVIWQGSTAVARLSWVLDCNGCDLSQADLSNIYLEESKLDGANFRGANLVGAWLTGASLRYADFSESNLDGAAFDRVDLQGAKFCNTTMPDGSINNQDC